LSRGVRLTFDDCSRTADGRWLPVQFFTQLDLTAREFKRPALAESQLAAIGLAVVARLGALTRTASSRKRRSTAKASSRSR
jgi:hypothetical protein